MKTRFVGVALLAAGSCAMAQPVVWDNGATTPVNFNGSETYLGYSSGNVAAGLEDRRAAMPFSWPADQPEITRVDASWFISVGSEAESVGYTIWNRTSLGTAPTAADEVASGILGAYGVGTDDPRVAGTEDWFHSYTGLSIPLGAGDYWISIYGVGLGANNTTGFGFLNWFTGAPGVDSEIAYNDYMWRASNYSGGAGFGVYNPAIILPGAAMTDPTDRWNTSFVLYGIPAPGVLSVLGLGAVAGLRRRR